MAVFLYTGPPGSGKSYAGIAQQLVPAMAKRRRILTNIDGVDPIKCRDYAVEVLGIADPAPVVTFHGSDAQLPGFWPTEIGGDAETFVKGGDLILFDEWALYFPSAGRMPTPDVEGFLRIHRHLTNADGTACDVGIFTQIAGDVHRNFRGLVERSFRFKKLKAVGLPKFYSWAAFEGHTQAKDKQYQQGTEEYDPKIFALYKSYGGDGTGVEQATDSRTTMFGKSIYWMAAGTLIMAAVGAYGTYSFFTDPAALAGTAPQDDVPIAAAGTTRSGVATSTGSEWRIVGYFNGNTGVRVVLGNRAGEFRTVDSYGYDFDGMRPIRGMYEGREVRSEDWLEAPDNPTMQPNYGDPYAPSFPAGTVPDGAVIQSGPGANDGYREAQQSGF